jgi:hypothetical protein
MNQTNRHSFLLTIAGVLLLFAIVAYLIGEAESNNVRHEAVLRDQAVFRDQNERAIADGVALHAETAKLDLSRINFRRQQDLLFESLRRIEALTRDVSALRDKIQRAEPARKEQANQH